MSYNEVGNRRCSRGFAVAIGLVAVLMSDLAQADTSKLWGMDGESWDPRGRLPDFSHAGYKGGGVPLPDVPVVATVKDFGAVGDGVTDDTVAFQTALAMAKPGAILVPKGRYKITDVLHMNKSGVVLRGEGADATGSVLYLPNSLADVYGPSVSWSWSGGFLKVDSEQTPMAGTPVTADAVRGDTSLAVVDSASFTPGQLVMVRLTDDAAQSLWRHLHADQEEKPAACIGNPLQFNWLVRVASVEPGRIELAQALRTDVRAAWKPEVAAMPAIEDVGIESLRLEFIEVPYAGHFAEPGYNGIEIYQGVVDSWIRDVTIVNADSSILATSYTKNVTIRGVRTEGRGGHHGIGLSFAADVLVEDFFHSAPWLHSAVISNESSGSVFSRGDGTQPISLDHHGNVPIESLYTQIPSYNLKSGGETCVLPHAGARITHWNLGAPMQLPLLWGHIQSNVIGEFGNGESMTENREWYENVSSISPPNIYEAQLATRVCPEVIDSCNQARFDAKEGVCVPVPRTEGSACDDGNSSTDNDACVGGTCKGQVVESASCAISRAATGDTHPGWALWLMVSALGLGLRRTRRDIS